MKKTYTSKKKNKQFAVLQMGARMNYAVPYFLFKANYLKMFYTDIHSNHLFFDFLNSFIPKRIMPKKLKNLLGRVLPNGLPKKFVKDSPLKSLLSNSNRAKAKVVFGLALKDRFAGANAIYTNFINDDIELIKKAKELGLYIVYEMITPPNIGLIHYEENKKFPDLCLRKTSLEKIKADINLDFIKWQLSDKILVPSKHCKDVAIEMGADQKKINLVPYGIDEKWLNLKAKPEIGKILFVGEISLGKGIHYFAEAARILKHSGKNYNFTAIGSQKIDTDNPLLSGPNYVGHIPRSEIIKEYLTADIFVLPSLSEGMAIVNLEAMACGLPVITTHNSGSIINDSKEGFLLSIRDSLALASKIEMIVEDRDLRMKMSHASFIKARNYTWKNYSMKLMEALNI